MKDVTLMATSEGSVSESDMEEKSSHNEQQPLLQSTSRVDSEMYGYTPFSDDVTPGQVTMEVTALSVDTVHHTTSQLTAPPDEILTEVIGQSSPPSSPTSSTVSVSSSLAYSEKDIVEGESADMEKLDNTLSEPLLPPDNQNQSLGDHAQQVSSNDQDDQIVKPHEEQTLSQLPDHTATPHNEDISTDLDHTTTLEATKSISQNSDEVITTEAVTSAPHSAPAVVTSQAVSSEPEDVSTARSQLEALADQPPVEATLPSQASEVELSDSQPATEISEASSKSSELAAVELDQVFKVGQRVLIGQKMAGVIQFVGQTMFAPGVWIGVELDLAKGTNDGSMAGIRYFTCEPSHGLFAPPSKVELQPTGAVVSPPAPNSVKTLSPDVSTEQVSSVDEVTYSIHKEDERVETVTAGLVTQLADEAVHDMTTIWCSRTTQDVMANKLTDQLLALLLRSEVEVMCKMNEKKREEPTVKTPTKQLKLSTKSVELSPPPILTPPSPFYFDHPAKISGTEEVSPLRPVTVDLNRADSPPRQQQTARVMAGDVSPPHSPPLSPVAAASRPLSESRCSSVESITQLLETHPVDTSQFFVPNDRSAVDAIVASAWNNCHQLTTEELHSKHIALSREATKLPQSLSEEEMECVVSYQELVFELAVEVIRELRPRPTKPRPVWMPPRPVNLSREPVTLERVQSLVYTRLMKGQLPFTLPVARYIHGGRRVCGRDVDFVEALLIKELRSEEKEWTNYDEDEEQVKLQTADAILESLLVDTINVMNDIVCRKSAAKL